MINKIISDKKGNPMKMEMYQFQKGKIKLQKVVFGKFFAAVATEY